MCLFVLEVDRHCPRYIHFTPDDDDGDDGDDGDDDNNDTSNDSGGRPAECTWSWPDNMRM